MPQINWFKAVALTSLLVLFKTEPAYAYLDPGTASLVLQGIVGAIGAALVAGGIYWRKFTALFTRGRTEHADDGSAEAPLTTPHDRNTR